MSTRAEQLAMALDEFLQTTSDVEAAAVVSVDGLTMASALPPQIEEDRLGAMAAALLSLGEKAAEGLGRGSLAQVFVEGEYGFVFLMAAGDTAVLAAITRPSCKIGLVLYEMRHSCQRIASVLDQPAAPVAELRAAPDLLS
jgi:predicted regulator of Ras-like GTPase activity (Roadblock/LC7/MglB family)